MNKPTAELRYREGAVHKLTVAAIYTPQGTRLDDVDAVHDALCTGCATRAHTLLTYLSQGNVRLRTTDAVDLAALTTLHLLGYAVQDRDDSPRPGWHLTDTGRVAAELVTR